MIKVLKIEAHEFRGIRDLSIDFAGENFAICGRNGTGKSGIVDALEFGLTGNVSRLSGKGTGDVSLREHGPHVDSRNRPDKARVKLTVQVPNIEKPVTIERTVKDAQTPTITPNTPAVLEALGQVALHPEFVLSRRELIRYVISAPGDRAREVQALLQLDAVDVVRATLQKIANACERAVNPLKRATAQAHDQLLAALQISEWSAAKVLAAVNAKRGILGLAPLAALAANTSVRDGLAVTTTAATTPRLTKAQAIMRDPYYIIPDGEVGQQAFAVIREAIRKEGMVALGKVVFTSREHIIALEARDKGLMGITLRYPYEVRDQNEYFDDIENEKVPKDMLDLAIHIVETKKGTFEPEKFEDQYEDALKELIRKKQKGEKIERPAERAPSNVVNLMDALRKSVKGDRGGAQQKPGRSKAKKGKKRIEGQREMLLPITGKKGKESSAKSARSGGKQRKAG